MTLEECKAFVLARFPYADCQLDRRYIKPTFRMRLGGGNHPPYVILQNRSSIFHCWRNAVAEILFHENKGLEPPSSCSLRKTKDIQYGATRPVMTIGTNSFYAEDITYENCGNYMNVSFTGTVPLTLPVVSLTVNVED